MKIDPTLFVGASGAIATLLIAILSVLVGQVRWQSRMETKIEQIEATQARVEERVHALEMKR